MAFVKQIVSDNWTHTGNDREETAFQSVDQALRAVRSLNGRNRTQIFLEGDGRLLMIGGGNNGCYSVQIIVGQDEAFYTLTNPASREDREVEIVTGGQAGMFPESQCVDLNSAIEAVREFVASGQPSKSGTWEHEE